jgi:Ca2+-binding EF-hand superfamily protein
MRSISLLLTFALVVLALPIRAEGQPPTYDPKAAHAEADRNGDGMVDREEFHQRMVEVFFHADRDKDGFMTFEELEATVSFPQDFRDADTDGDGRISLYEFMRVRFYDYDRVDTNGDGLLSVDEVVAEFARPRQ